MRQHIVTASASPADVQREAERIAALLREQGNIVTVGEVEPIQSGHKAGLPAITLTIEEPAVVEPVAPETVSAGEQVAPADAPTDALNAPAEPEPAVVWDKDHAVAPALASEDDPESWRAAETQAIAEPEAVTPPAAPKHKGGRPKDSKNKTEAAV